MEPFQGSLRKEFGNSFGGVVYIGYRNGELGFYTETWERIESVYNKDFTTYEGEIKNGSPNGQGTSTNPDGSKYIGEFKNVFPNGQGTMTWSDGGKYIGEWKDGKRNGQGTTTIASGTKFVGEHKDEIPWNGTGYNKDGNIGGKKVNGEWK